MKQLLLSLLTFCCFTAMNAQTFTLTVNNGYGSGNYAVGDTVHIWSVAYDSTKVFGKWIGDSQFLKGSREWHTTLVMPNQNVSVTAVINNMPTYNIAYEAIMGQNSIKRVYYCFPSNLKGIIYFFNIDTQLGKMFALEKVILRKN